MALTAMILFPTYEAVSRYRHIYATCNIVFNKNIVAASPDTRTTGNSISHRAHANEADEVVFGLRK